MGILICPFFRVWGDIIPKSSIDHGYLRHGIDITKDVPENDYEPRVIRLSVNRGQKVNRTGSDLDSSVRWVTELGAVFVINAFSQIDLSMLSLNLNGTYGL